MDDTLTDPLAGRLLDGRYAVTARIAHGGMATVYLALDTRLDRQVALKVMHAELARDDEFVRRFIGEAKSVAKLSHQNVVAVYDQGADGQFLYLAMEYVPGRTLKDLLREYGRFSPAAALDIMAGVLDGLAAAHRSGIVHRDVKPENVLLTADGRVKVADFGLARAQAATGHTRSGLIIGTVAYLAPELVTGGTPIGPYTDVYSAGVLLYELLTGRQPFTGETPISVAYQHVNSDVPAPSALLPEIPASVDRLVRSATEHDPAVRPADAAAFLNAIRQVRAELGPPAAAQAGRVSTGPNGYGTAPNEYGTAPDGYGTGPNGYAGPGPTGLTGRIGPGAQGLAEAPWLDAESWPGTNGWQAAGGQGGTNGWSTQPGGGLPGNTGGFGFAGDGGSHTMVVHRDEVADYLGRGSFLGRWLFSRRLIGVVLVFALAVGLSVGGWWYASGRYTSIPTVAGDTVAAATTALTHNGFKVKTGAEENSNSVPKGMAAATSPSGRALKGSTITILVSAGPFTSVVPAVRGDTLAAAKSALAGKHLNAVVQKIGSTMAKGTVVGTTPKAGTTWPQTHPVTILVAGGQPLPNFVGMQQGAAAQLAAHDQLSVTYVKKSSSDRPTGQVLAQSPVKGSLMYSGEHVTLTVSSGPPEVAVPDVKGMSPEQARTRLEEAGFTVNVLGSDFFGKVTGENPSGKAPYGSEITINVASGGGGGCTGWLCF
jgi:serine/threonine-protein kinase